MQSKAVKLFCLPTVCDDKLVQLVFMDLITGKHCKLATVKDVKDHEFYLLKYKDFFVAGKIGGGLSNMFTVIVFKRTLKHSQTIRTTEMPCLLWLARSFRIFSIGLPILK